MVMLYVCYRCGEIHLKNNEAKMRNPLKFAGVPQTRQPLLVVSGPKFTISWQHVEEILLFYKFFSIVGACLSLRRYRPTKLCDGAQMANFGSSIVVVVAVCT